MECTGPAPNSFRPSGLQIWSMQRRPTKRGPDTRMISDKRILLTGGAGFIGTSLARRLIDKNHVVIFDNGHRDALTGTPLENSPNVTRIKGDVLSLPALKEAIKECSI